MNVITKPKILKAVRLMPQKEQVLFAKLVRDLHEKGPVLPNWPNYKKTREHKYASLSPIIPLSGILD